jgi:hypothetical protein
VIVTFLHEGRLQAPGSFEAVVMGFVFSVPHPSDTVLNEAIPAPRSDRLEKATEACFSTDVLSEDSGGMASFLIVSRNMWKLPGRNLTIC